MVDCGQYAMPGDLYDLWPPVGDVTSEDAGFGDCRGRGDETLPGVELVADLDIVMKPILDAVTGPDGVLIDDNQIHSIKASWMTPGAHGPGFRSTFERSCPMST